MDLQERCRPDLSTLRANLGQNPRLLFSKEHYCIGEVGLGPKNLGGTPRLLIESFDSTTSSKVILVAIRAERTALQTSQTLLVSDFNILPIGLLLYYFLNLT